MLQTLRVLVFFGCLLLLLSTGCDLRNPFGPLPTPTDVPTPTSLPTATPSPTNTPLPTPTNTPIPTPTPRVSSEECAYIKWLGGRLLNLAIYGNALTSDEDALKKTTIFDTTWRNSTLSDLAGERDATEPIRAGYGQPVPPALADLDRVSRDYSARVYAATAAAYTALSNFDPFAFNTAYRDFGPLSADGDRLSNSLDSWARGRGYSAFAAAALTCR